MQIKLLKTLKADKEYSKGTVFVGPESAIPHDIMMEVKAGSKIVEVLEWDPAPPESKLEEPIQAQNPEVPPENELEGSKNDEAPLVSTDKEKENDQEASAEPEQPREPAASTKPKLKKSTKKKK